MQFVGKEDEIDKPEIKANGLSISTLSIDMSVGEIASCSFAIPPEYAKEFAQYDKKVEIFVKSEKAFGYLFKGKVAGFGFSNTTGRIQFRVDLVHEAAKELDLSGTKIPGMFPSSLLDGDAWVKLPEDEASVLLKTKTSLATDTSLDFWKAVKATTLHYIRSENKSKAGHEMPLELNKIENAINLIESSAGIIVGGRAVSEATGAILSRIYKNSGMSSTFWNALSIFFSQYDLVMSCKPDGKIALLPNFSGMEGVNSIDQKYIISFDQSSQLNRTPLEFLVLPHGVDVGGESAQGFEYPLYMLGKYKYPNPPENAHGVFCVGVPPFLKDTNFVAIKKLLEKNDFFNKYAELVAARQLASLMTCNLVTPLCLDVFPGVGVKFNHISAVKTFSGDPISSLNGSFDGYCWRISHSVSSGSAPMTTFSFSNVTMGMFQKLSKHPIWPDGKQPIW